MIPAIALILSLHLGGGNARGGYMTGHWEVTQVGPDAASLNIGPNESKTAQQLGIINVELIIDMRCPKGEVPIEDLPSTVKVDFASTFSGEATEGNIINSFFGLKGGPSFQYPSYENLIGKINPPETKSLSADLGVGERGYFIYILGSTAGGYSSIDVKTTFSISKIENQYWSIECVPEPSSLVLLGPGAVTLLGCAAWRFRTRGSRGGAKGNRGAKETSLLLIGGWHW